MTGAILFYVLVAEIVALIESEHSSFKNAVQLGIIWPVSFVAWFSHLVVSIKNGRDT